MDDFGWIDEYLVAEARREAVSYMPSHLLHMQYPATSASIEFGVSSIAPSTELEHLALTQGPQVSIVDLPGSNKTALDQHDGSVSRYVSYMEFHNSTSGNLDTSSKHGNSQETTSCAECDEKFSSQDDLGLHARNTGHDACTCEVCGAKFSRYDVLVRHRSKHSAPTKLWPCALCRKWKAPNGFARKDHLLQHQRNYHHVDDYGGQYSVSPSDPAHVDFFAHCTHKGCSKYLPTSTYGYWASSDRMFESRAAFTKHMREDHDETPFPCKVPGCKKVNRKGFFRKRSLMRHMKAVHEVDEENTETQEDGVGEMGALTMDNDASFLDFTTLLESADPGCDESALW